ncbi:MAG TPA: metallophosphoesterase [Rectinemataceae bacterium]
MKILALSDIHGNLRTLDHILAEHSDAALILVAGDLTNFGGAKEAEEILHSLCSHPAWPSVCLVPGNCDPLPARRILSGSGLDVDGTGLSTDFCRIAGAGGGLRRAGLTSYERTEEELGQALRRGLAAAAADRAIGKEGSESPLVVLTHNPPYGTNADRRADTHVGSHVFSTIMAEACPTLWVCGHIHESRCVSLEDGTLIVNPGPCSAGSCAIIDLRVGPGGRNLSEAALAT